MTIVKEQDVSTQELIIYPAKLVRTMDPSRPTATAVAVRGDRIRAVGSVEELAAYGAARIDERYADAVLLPGFVEAHTHAFGGAMWKHTYVGYRERMSPDGRRWPGCTTLEAVVQRLREADAALPDDRTPLTAWGLDPIFFPGERLDRRLLDQVSTTRPIFVMHQSFHLATVNSALLRLDGITADTAVHGVVKDGSGEPIGELQEAMAMALVKSVPAMLSDTAGLDEALRNFAADARNHGVTTATDLANRNVLDDAVVARMRQVVDDDTYPCRLSVFHLAHGAGSTPEAAQKLVERRSSSSAKLRFGHVKFVLDGSIQGFTARLQEPGYLVDGCCGLWVVPPDEFPAQFERFHRAGLLVHAHVNGDEATEVFLDAVEAALEAHPRGDHRHTAQHSQLSTPDQYRRMSALGMCANLFVNHIYYWGDEHRDRIIGPDRAHRMNATATALRAGVPLSMHCDSPVTPLDVLATISIAATRKTASGKVLGEQEKLTVEQALYAMTLGSSYQLKMDHEVGSIQAGKYADFAVLDGDPLGCSAEDVREIKVRGTMVGGRAFDAPG